MVNCAKRPKRPARLPNEERRGMEDKEEVFFRMNRLSLLSFIDNNCSYLLKKRNEKM